MEQPLSRAPQNGDRQQYRQLAPVTHLNRQCNICNSTMSKTATPNTSKPPETGAVDLNGLRILLVEDSWHVARAMQRLLQLLGADVVGPAATTAEAERLISEHAPDVALVDVNLRGGELAYGMIDRLHDRGIRVVVMSGYADVPLARGKAAAILEKPVDEAQLITILRSLTPGAMSC
jgi:CheY-like chemotaxis protein